MVVLELNAWRRCADDPATLPHLIACRMGAQGLFVIKHRAEIANVEPAFTEVKLNCRRPMLPPSVIAWSGPLFQPLWPNLKFAVANDSTTRDNYSTSGNVNPYTALLERGTPASKPGRRICEAAYVGGLTFYLQHAVTLATGLRIMPT